MKVLIGSLLVLINMNFSFVHDIKLAHFTIHVESHKIVCDARIDIDDFNNAIGTKENQEINQFFNQHLEFKIDGKLIPFSVIHQETNEEWIKVRFQFESATTSPFSIEVFNDLLIDTVDGQDNIMRFLFHDKTRVFRLNEKRQKISFDYKKYITNENK